jgi:hypothetical protein
MELKLDRDIDWYDLPEIESPFYAVQTVKYGNPIYGQVENIDILNPGSSFARRTIVDELIDALENGDVFFLKNNPTSPVFRWVDKGYGKGYWELSGSHGLTFDMSAEYMLRNVARNHYYLLGKMGNGLTDGIKSPDELVMLTDSLGLNTVDPKKESKKTTEKKIQSPPASLDEAAERLAEARKRLISDGFKPKYTDEELAAIAAKGDVNDRFIVRFFDSKYAKDDGYLGPKNDGKVRFWSTTFDQIENADTDPKRISECLGLKYDSKKNYTLVLVDTVDADKYGDSCTIIPTYEKLGEFAASEIKDLPEN